MQTGSAPITADQLWAMPEDGTRRELARGVLRTVSPAGWEHGAIAAALAGSLIPHVQAHGLGIVTVAEAGYLLERRPDTVYAPDVAFVRSERLPRGRARQRFFEGAPDLAAEVVSPTDSWAGVMAKANDYLAAGTRMVLILEPQGRRVHALRPGGPPIVLDEGAMLDGADVVRGWEVAVADLFAVP